MNSDQKWIEDIRRQAGSYKRKAPEGLLDDIKREMSQRGVMPPKQRRQPRLAIVWTRRISVAAAIALAVVMVVRNVPGDGSQSIVADSNRTGAETQTKQPANGSLPAGNGATSGEGLSGEGIGQIVEHIINKAKDEGNLFLARLTGNGQVTPVGTELVADNMSTDGSNEPEMLSAAPNNVQSESVDEHRSIANEPQHSAQRQNKMARNWYGKQTNMGLSTNERSNNFSIAMNYSGMGSSSSTSGFGFNSLNSMSMPIKNDMPEGDYVALAKGVSETTTTAHHDMPVKLGISLRYNVGKRLSFQTGLNYSYLSSDITRENNMEEYSSRQKLHYLSVPVTASYSVWQNKNFNVYLSAGAEAGKLVKGKADVEHVVYNGNGDVTNSSENISEHRLQYSVSGAAGIEYKAGNRINFYAEPGVTRYFNNHSSVVNIYKDKQTQFTINVGLRINLNKK